MSLVLVLMSILLAISLGIAIAINYGNEATIEERKLGDRAIIVYSGSYKQLNILILTTGAEVRRSPA